jgi:release factor glutamine methyltransferase
LNIGQLLGEAIEQLRVAGVLSARVDAELLLAHSLKKTKADLLLLVAMNGDISEEDVALFSESLQHRIQREPLQHITGIAYFRNLELLVGPGVFIPRPETELIVQAALDFAAKLTDPVLIDLGTGSGAIAISIATELPEAKVYAIEISEQAFVFTKANFEKYSVDSSRLRLGDLADSFSELAGQASVVISNPPYIPLDAIPRDLEVRLHDPELALYGGTDGLDVVRKVSERAKFLLKPSGLLLIEHADSQSSAIRQLLLQEGWIDVLAHQDLTGRDRFVSAKRISA